jgi:hypothetical protein
MEKLIDIVRNSPARLVWICNGKVYFEITTDKHLYQLEIDSTSPDWKDSYIVKEYNARELMRWIRLGIDNNDGTFIILK